MNQHSSKVVLRNLEESVAAALDKLAPKANIPVAGKLVASKDVRVQLLSHVAAMDASSDARAKFVQAVSADKAQRAQMGPLLSAIRSYAAGVYGEGSPEFALFGFKPKRFAYRTVQVKAEAVEKLRATRAARHTMGKRQKAAIHGTVAASDGGPTATPPNGSAPSPSPVTPPTNGASA